MQKSLLRQLKRSLGVGDEAALGELLARLREVSEGCDPALQQMASGFGEFLERVDASYEQYERDLELRTRSLELSSAELTGSNEKLRLELLGREHALRSLRQVVQGLLPVSGSDHGELFFPDDDIATLSQRISELVAESEQGRRALSDQKFALDQHAIVSITNIKGEITYANDRFCTISGYSRDELIGQNHRMVKSDFHAPEVYQGLWETVANGRVWHGEICNRAKNGELYWVSATIVPLLGDDGKPVQYIGIRTDITDRKNMEAQLFEQLHLVEELFEAIPQPVYLKDPSGRYLRLNRAFEIFFGVKREDYIGRTLYDLLRHEDAWIHSQKDAELFLGKGTQTYEAVVQTRDGQLHDTIYRKATLTRHDGSVSGLLGTIIDITERKRAEVEVLKAKDAAEAASRAKSDFLANMSHEIRTPMNGIIGMTDLALDTDLNEEQREFLSIVKSSAESLLTIINDILDFSKIEAGKLQVEEISFDLNRVVAETLKSLALQTHEKRIELIQDVMPDVPRHVFGDPSRIRQVLINLLGNAIKFTAEGEIALRVELGELENGDPGVHFSVRDTGIGIPLDKQQLIFEAFTQEDTSTTRRFGGTGLGLTITRRLIELMGGKIWLESEVGRGSIFHFMIRLQVDSQPPQPISTAIDLSGRRLLVVDDNETNRRILCAMLATWDIDAVDVPSGAAALVTMRQETKPFDCIILDAHMPEMDGYELAERLHAEFPRLPPMMMLSSGAMRGDGQRCISTGIAGFFSKPISSEDLLAALGRVFDDQSSPSSATQRRLINRHALHDVQRSLNVLLVEDHPVNQKLALGLLEKWGHKALLAVNGQEACDFYSQGEFDLILMDMQMPVMGGLQATRLIRAFEKEQQRTRTPIIAMTAAAMEDDREACIVSGMDDYLSKPIKVKELFEKLLLVSAEATAKPGEGQVFDYGAALLGADQETVEIIAEIFLDTWARDMARIRDSLQQQDSAVLERTAHSFRGTLASFNATPAVKVATELEKQARFQPMGDLNALIEQLDSEIKALVPHVERVRKQFSG